MINIYMTSSQINDTFLMMWCLKAVASVVFRTNLLCPFLFSSFAPFGSSPHLVSSRCGKHLSPFFGISSTIWVLLFQTLLFGDWDGNGGMAIPLVLESIPLESHLEMWCKTADTFYMHASYVHCIGHTAWVPKGQRTKSSSPKGPFRVRWVWGLVVKGAACDVETSMRFASSDSFNEVRLEPLGGTAEQTTTLTNFSFKVNSISTVIWYCKFYQNSSSIFTYLYV